MKNRSSIIFFSALFLCSLMFSSCELGNFFVDTSSENMNYAENMKKIEEKRKNCLDSAQSEDEKEKCQETYENDTANENERHKQKSDAINNKYKEREKCMQYQESVLERWGYEKSQAKYIAKGLKEGSSTKASLLEDGVKERTFRKNEGYEFDANDAIAELIHQGYIDNRAIEKFKEELPKFGLSSNDAIKATKQYYDDELYTFYFTTNSKNPAFKSKDNNIKDPNSYRIGYGVKVDKDLLVSMGFIDEDDEGDENEDEEEEKEEENGETANKIEPNENNSQNQTTKNTNENGNSYQVESDAVSKMSISKYSINETKLTSEQKRDLDDVVSFMKKWPDSKITIVGHTCSLGNDAVNNRIGLNRAHRAKQYLLENGIDESRIEEISKAATEPCTSNDTEDGRLQNRRITFIVK